jgi:prepilin-type N-terminal cleavage/methylation domain-containing protein
MRKGFSLIELSIVLVILGLLVGGILAGKSLIRASELRNLSTDIDKAQTAVAAFRDRYFGFPGDITNATSFWGKDTTNCNGHTGAAGSPGTCNGDGSGSWANGSYFKQYIAWQHLSLAGLWPGTWPGIASIAPGQSVAGDNSGVNLPVAKVAGAYGLITYKFRSGGYRWISSVSTALYMASPRYNACCGAPFIDGSGLVAAEWWNLDTKLDDGKPGFGKLRTDSLYWGNCASTNVAATAEYTLTSTGSGCAASYDIGLNR